MDNISSLPPNCTSETYVKAALVKSFEDLDKAWDRYRKAWLLGPRSCSRPNETSRSLLKAAESGCRMLERL